MFECCVAHRAPFLWQRFTLYKYCMIIMNTITVLFEFLVMAHWALFLCEKLMLYKYCIIIMNTITVIFNLESIVKRKRTSEFLVIVEMTVLRVGALIWRSWFQPYRVLHLWRGSWWLVLQCIVVEERVKCNNYGLSVAVTRTWRCDGQRPTSWWRWWSAWGRARSWVGSRTSPTVSCPLLHSSSWMDQQRPGTVELLDWVTERNYF